MTIPSRSATGGVKSVKPPSEYINYIIEAKR